MSDLAGKWGWSTCRERYYGDFETREEALAEGRSMDPHSGIFTAQYEAIHVPGLCAVHVIDEIEDAAYSEVGEAAEGWLSGTTKDERKILEDRLNEVLFKWLEEFGYKPNFAAVIESTVQEHEPAVTE
jgi:hypothetical protein